LGWVSRDFRTASWLTSLKLANVKVFKDVKTIVAVHKGVSHTKWVKEEIELKWSDTFWLFFLKYYAKVMEGMIPFVCPRFLSPRTSLCHWPSNTRYWFAGAQTQSRFDSYSSWRQRHSNVLHSYHNGRHPQMDSMPTFGDVQSMVDMVHIHSDGVRSL